ncbi:MAG: hypothetical protein JWO82_3786 [Akkermansiaceae bacterium]|nr:hypothetical protein [Akkermansiaceae bacterium]
MTARFIQVDLEIEAVDSLAPVCEAFAESGLFELHHLQTERGYFAAFEMTVHGEAEEDASDDPEDFIAGFCGLIEEFGAEARACWEGAFRKTFDIGYESTGVAGVFTSGLSPGLLSRMSALGVSLGVTIYPPSVDAPVVIL